MFSKCIAVLCCILTPLTFIYHSRSHTYCIMSSYIHHKVLDQYAIRYLFPDDGDGESALTNDDDDK